MLRRIEPPTRDEIAHVRDLYEKWLAEPDQLGTLSLAWRIPRLLARIEWLEHLLATRGGDEC